MKVRVTEDGLEFTGDTFGGSGVLEIALASCGDQDTDDEDKQRWAAVLQDMIDHCGGEMST